MNNSWLKEGERKDKIGFGHLELIQQPKEFCYGIDAVLLAAFAQVKPGARVADLGTGTGIIPLILSHKTQADEIIGVEIQEGSYDRAERNIRLNGLTGRVKIIHSDVKGLLDGGQVLRSSFDVVVSNPPYVKGKEGLTNQNQAKAMARHETTASLPDFICTAAALLKDRGDFYLVHRPSRLVDICVICREHRLEPKDLRMVSPTRSQKPNIVLLHCVKYGGTELNVLAPLSVYDEEGRYTAEIEEIYERY